MNITIIVPSPAKPIQVIVGSPVPVDGSITNTKLAYMAQATIKGRQAGAGTGAPEDLTAAQARTAMGLGSAATTASTDYATEAQGTDSREWTADTVAQAEAEAGSATTRRAWTAQRVRQAIAAWWATVSSTKADASHAHAWGDITSGVPLTFAPSAHNHPANEITGLGNAALATTSTGGNGASDDGKVLLFLSTGFVSVTGLNLGDQGTGNAEIVYDVVNFVLKYDYGGGPIVLATTADPSGVPDNLIPSSAGTVPVDTDGTYVYQAGAKLITFADLWTWIKSKVEAVALVLFVQGYSESVVPIGTVISSHTISLTDGTVQTATLTASTACTFTMPTAAAGLSFILHLKQAASTGNGTAVFTGVIWPAATAPTITATAGKMDILSFVAGPDAAGTGYKWYGSALQNFTPA